MVERVFNYGSSYKVFCLRGAFNTERVFVVEKVFSYRVICARGSIWFKEGAI